MCGRWLGAGRLDGAVEVCWLGVVVESGGALGIGGKDVQVRKAIGCDVWWWDDDTRRGRNAIGPALSCGVRVFGGGGRFESHG